MNISLPWIELILHIYYLKNLNATIGHFMLSRHNLLFVATGLTANAGHITRLFLRFLDIVERIGRHFREIAVSGISTSLLDRAQ